MQKRTSVVQSSAAAVSKPGVRDYEVQRIEKEFLQEGYITGLAVSQRAAGANMSVDIAAGIALVEITNTNVTHGQTYKVYFTGTGTADNVVVPDADPSNPRKDIIVLTIDVETNPDTSAGNIASIELVQGTPAGSPTAPAVPDNSILLATISVAAGATSITTGNITDGRTPVKLGGSVLPEVARQGFIGLYPSSVSGTDTITAVFSPVLTALSSKLTVLFVPANDNTGAVTFNPDGLGAAAIVKYGSTALEAGDLRAKVASIIQYNSTDGNWKLLSVPGNPPTNSTLTISEKTADYSVLGTTSEQGKVFDNKSATGTIILSLPAAAAGLNYTFVCAAAQYLSIQAATGNTIEDAATSMAGYSSNATHSVLTLFAIDTSKWVVRCKTGTWTTMFSKGYWMGGGGSGTVIVGFRFDTEATANLAATLDTSRAYLCGASSTKAGYAMGGTTNSAVISKLTFADEAEANLAATLDTGRQEIGNGGWQSSTKGYCLGGYAAGTTIQDKIDDINFSNDTSAQLAAVLPAARGLGVGVSSSTKAYYMGGKNSGGAATNSIYALTFSGETTATLGATLAASKHSAGGNVQSATNGYVSGGSATNTAIYKFAFSGESISTLGATLDTGRSEHTGIMGLTKGYWAGGSGPISSIENMNTSDDSSAAIGATLPAANSVSAGVHHPL